MSNHKETKTLDEFLAENPNVDVTEYWRRCWGILTALKDKIARRFPELQQHPSTFDRDYYTSPNGEWEGSYQAWSGPGVDWLVNSWIGNRKASILDMNTTAFLDQQTDVPHLVIVFGTVPHLFCYCDYTPRRNLLTNVDYLDKYFNDEVNDWYLKLRSNPNFHWSVSHGPYMRALNNPATQSLMGELSHENISVFENYLHEKVDRWLGWLDAASPVPVGERASLQQQDHIIREMSYRRDPMNKLAVKVFGAEEVERMIELRMGQQQIAETRQY
ncbi:hypothetical protein [Alkalimonas sp.]|uniref:hypothetical protein n=1 Tax=Alkalimonas sp. TaxID=1872453 RepID=UPI00263AA8D5|nr:hypothetical protein [Alkalimonas sp.]MCC5825012.1 hypothetical protein [Alkalimonas sp.]